MNDVAKSATGIDASLAFLKLMFEHTERDVYVGTFPNQDDKDNEHGERKIVSRDEKKIAAFVNRYDKPGRAIYFCVGTINAETRDKDTIDELPTLHVDVDFKDIVNETPESLLRKLRALKFPPSWINTTGHGYHLYWFLTEPYVLPTDAARQDAIVRFETVLKLLCDLLGGDTMPAHVAGLMRVPGSHNSKRSEWTKVQDVEHNGLRFEFGDIEEWCTEVSPIVLRKIRPAEQSAGSDNVWDAYLKDLGYKPSVDVEKRLNGMTYMAGGGASIHDTQLSVTASMTIAGRPVDEIVEVVMKATQAAAADYGKSWNWKREEKRVRGMIADCQKKIGKGKLGATSSAATADGATVIDFNSKKQQSDDRKAKAKAAKQERLSQFPLIGGSVLKSLWERGIKLLTTRDQLWRCDSGIWSLMDVGARQSIEVEIETVCANLQIDTEIKLVAEVRAWIMRRPELRREHVIWDAHGKIPTKTGLIDPKSLTVEPLTSDHYATWIIDVVYDAKASCPWWERALLDMFGDRPCITRRKIIQLLQEMLGVGLLDDKPKALTKALILVGGSNSGKTTLIEVCSGLLTDNPIATSLETLGGTHGAMQFIRRAPWTLHEAFDSGKWHPSSKVKQIISGDPIDINIKNGPLITRRITQPIFWGSNAPVQIREATDAMRNRVIVIECRQVFKESELIGAGAEAVRRGFEKPHQMILMCEKAGLLNWALIGMRRAMDRGKFETIEEVEEALEEMRNESNIVASFLEECVEYGPNYRTRVSDFCAAFSVHWEQNKSTDRSVPSNDNIGRALKAFGDSRIAVRSKELRDTDHRYYAGMHLNRAGLDFWDEATTHDRVTGKSARTSTTRLNVNQFIPTTWDTKLTILRLRKGFPIETQAKEDEGEKAVAEEIDKTPRF